MNYPEDMPPVKSISQPITEAEIVKQRYELDIPMNLIERANKQAVLDSISPEEVKKIGDIFTGKSLSKPAIDSFGIRNILFSDDDTSSQEDVE